MIETITIFWIVVGLGTGCFHAFWLWRSTQTFSSSSPLVGMLRLLVVTLLFVTAALLGGVLPTALGWTCGFALCIAWFLTMGTRPKQTPSNSSSDDMRRG